MEMLTRLAETGLVMNTTKRLMFGVLASLLLAVGFAQAADRLDPMSQSVKSTINGVMDGPGPSCTSPCDEGSGGEP